MKDKFNPYGIEKDYECKECFHQCYDKEVGDYVMGGCNLSENVKYEKEKIDWLLLFASIHSKISVNCLVPP